MRATDWVESDPVFQDFVYGLMALHAGWEDGDKGMFQKGLVAVTVAARDLASRGELRKVEGEFNELLVGMTKRKSVRRLTGKQGRIGK